MKNEPYKNNSYKNSSSPSTKILPNCEKTERAVIASLLIDKQAYARVEEMLRPESFFDVRNRLIYRAVAAIQEESGEVDLITVMNQLRHMGKLEEAGGPIYLAEVAEEVALSIHLESYAAEVALLASKREIIEMATELSGRASQDVSEVDELMVQAEQGLEQISRQIVRKGLTPVGEPLAQAFERIRRISLMPGHISGLASGYAGLDAITSGWQPQDLIIIAARPAMGKTAFVLSMVRQMVMEQGAAVALFSLEMSSVQLSSRLIMAHCGIEGDRLRSGAVEPQEWAEVAQRMAPLYRAPLYIDETGAISIAEMRAKARRAVRDWGVKLIVVDYLQLMTAGGSGGGGRWLSREQEVSAISSGLKGMAKELEVPVIALSQLNRNVESRTGEGKRPQLSDLRESGAIEQDADMVCFLHRPEYYGITEDDRGNNLRGVAELIIAKHRNGAVGSVRLRFRQELALFEDAPVVETRRENCGVSEGEEE